VLGEFVLGEVLSLSFSFIFFSFALPFFLPFVGFTVFPSSR
jgi:hypothetical protein